MSEEESTTGSAITQALFALISFTVRTCIRFGVTIGLVASIVITLYAVGQFSKDAVKERKQVLDLIYWRDPKKSAVVLGLTVILLLIFAKYPLIIVLSYLGLAVLGGTLGFRLYKFAEAQLKKSDGANPFQPYLEKELTVPQERVHQQIDVFVEHGQLIANQLRRLFLVESITESAKFGLLLWALTYVGSWFSGLCILLLVVLGVFSIPKFYETYQEPIDRNMGVAKEQINNLTNTMNEKLPFLKKVTGGAHEKAN